jgi:hypothetical protein
MSSTTSASAAAAVKAATQQTQNKPMVYVCGSCHKVCYWLINSYWFYSVNSFHFTTVPVRTKLFI